MNFKRIKKRKIRKGGENMKEHVLEDKKNKNKEKQNSKKWEKPTLEDVSKKIMAQPYIRFT